MNTAAPVATPALVLGTGGLIPFVGLALLAAVGPAADHVYWLTALSYYGAVILSFVGALHWAHALRRNAAGQGAWIQYGFSVLPPLLAWLSLLFPVWTALQLQALALLACYAFDRVMARIDPLPPWFMRLRAALTGVAAASLLAASLV
jgi:hypothetical protein